MEQGKNMEMDKEWFSTNELLGIAGLPKSRQGLNKKARDNGWERRRRIGIQGKGVEYAIWSLPEDVKKTLIQETPPDYMAPQQPTLWAAWVQIFHQLSETERSHLINYILREGVLTMLSQLEGKTKNEST